MTTSRNLLQVLFQLCRVRLSILAAGFVLAGIYLNEVRADVGTIVAMALIVSLVVSYSFVVNDWIDKEADRITKPQRWIPSGAISYTETKCVMIVLVGSSLLISLLINPSALAFTALAIILSTLYSYRLKALPLVGNATTAALNASTVIFPGFVCQSFSLAGIYSFALMFATSMTHELLYHLEDSTDDTLAGTQTTATKLGKKVTLTLVIAFMLLSCLLVVSPLLIFPPTILYVLISFPCIIILCWMIRQLLRNQSEKSIHGVRMIMRYMFYAGLALVLSLRTVL